MSNVTDLIDRYFEMWNETDESRRRALILSTWTPGASYVDPMLKADGPGGIDAMVQGVQAKYPGLRFRRVGPVDMHNDQLRFAWEFGPEGGAAVVKGIDFGTLGSEGRLQSITGFFDQVPAAA